VDDNLKKWLPWIAAGAVALIVIAIIGINLGGGDETAAPTTTALASTTVPQSTTVADTTTTTVAVTTTTTVAVTTTTIPATTTVPVTTTVALPPETTTVAPVPDTVSFTTDGIFVGDASIHFGFDDDGAIAAVTAVLGAPTSDSGWVAEPLCPPPVVRSVRWNDLWLLFTQADTQFSSGGVPHFFTYQYSGTTPELYTTEDIGIGSSLDMLGDAYGGPDLVIEESPFDATDGFWSYKAGSWTGMWGFATGQTPTDEVTSINGGRGCGE
jgi:hypothetical protein